MPAIRIENPNVNNRGAYVYIDLVSIVPTNEIGDNKYVFKLSTAALDIEGNNIEPLYLYNTSINGFMEALPKALAVLCSGIYWGEEGYDSDSPYVEYYGPVGNDVSLFSTVIVGITDGFPSKGIDPSSVILKVNGFDVTNDALISYNYNKLEVVWSPKRRVANGV